MVEEKRMKLKEEHYCQKIETSLLYRIEMFAMMNHITIKTLRYYEEQGPVSYTHLRAHET